MAAAVISLRFYDKLTGTPLETDDTQLLIASAVFLLAMVAYIILHELVHGVAYKIRTGERLTFGMSWGCAICGVPGIYTYRKTAIISVSAPLVLFSLILPPITALLYFVSPLYYLISAFILGIHWGGCSGDIYVLLLFGVKFRKKNVLMRDTGPEQFFYVKEEENG
jgi:hypothetical protein